MVAVYVGQERQARLNVREGLDRSGVGGLALFWSPTCRRCQEMVLHILSAYVVWCPGLCVG